MANPMTNRAGPKSEFNTRSQSKALSEDAAREVAVAVFGRIAADEERLGRFLELTGLRTDTIRSAASSPRFFEAVLEHVVGWEPLLIEIAGEISMRPEAIAAAHARLAPPPFD